VTRDWFVLYRPTAPSIRAQHVQVLATAGALAERGHRVTVCVQTRASAAAIRRAHGLPDSLDLVRLPRSNTMASIGYRLAFARYVRRTHGTGAVLARSKRHAAWALDWFEGRFQLLMEVHEVDSLRDDRDPQPLRELEGRVLHAASGVVANAPGTLDDLRTAHPVLPPSRVVQNGARPGGPPAEPGHDVGWVGSIREEKDPRTVAEAIRGLSCRVVSIGPSADEVAPLAAIAGDRLHHEPTRWPAAIPERLRRFRALLVPLSPGRFGERWSSPLKLFDALQSGVPVVAADTSAVRAIAGDGFVPYVPGDAASLRRAIERALDDEDLRERVQVAAAPRRRTWADRAADLERFADLVLDP